MSQTAREIIENLGQGADGHGGSGHLPGMMTDRPIIFSAPMIRALLAGRKAQTRRVITPQPGPWDALFSENGKWWDGDAETGEVHSCWNVPFAVGDRLWVREAHALVPATAYRASPGVVTRANPADRDQAAIYRAGWDRSEPGRWRPSIHMHRWASRLTLIVTEVRVQPLQEISEDDARAEGVYQRTIEGEGWWFGLAGGDGWRTARDAFRDLWNSIYGPDAWTANPWVIAISFAVERRNIDD